MSVTSLALVKADLRVTHNADDALIQAYIDSAEDEAMCFLNLPELRGQPSVQAAIFLLVRARYDGSDPDDIRKIRECAETLLMPYRDNMGV
jgi:hypothetical protein